MTTTRTGGSCLPSYRTQSPLALAEPADHVRELIDSVQQVSMVTLGAEARKLWDKAYSWLRLAQGLRAVTFDMSYDVYDSTGGTDFELAWSEMMAELQLHLVRLGYLRAALEGFVRLLHPDAVQPAIAIATAEQQLQHRAEALPVHVRAVAEHLGTHYPEFAGDSDTPVATGLVRALALHDNAVHGHAVIPEPAQDKDMNSFAAGHVDICAAREASTMLMLGIQLLMAAAVKGDKLVILDDKYLDEGMWIPDASSRSRWVDQEMPYGDYLSVLHLVPGESSES